MGFEAAAQVLEGLAVAEWLRGSRWGYAATNALHIFGIGLLIGATMPLNLRLLGLWRSVEVTALYRVLWPVAAAGLALAVASGALLFAARATEYAALGLFRLKASLIALGAGHAFVLHCMRGFPAVSQRRRIAAAVISLLVWPAVLVCGRLLAFV